jgi:non-ribosomal peptide synthetase component E (peptide arylation enzyme)
MVQLLEGVVPYRTDDIELYIKRKWWRGLTLGELLDRAADMHPDKEAFVDLTTRYTYQDARHRADKFALKLLDLGIQPLDRVLIQVPNWVEFAIAYFACQKMGAIVVLLIDRYRQLEINELASLTNAKAWIVAVKYGKTDYEPIVSDVLAENPQIKSIISVRGRFENLDYPSLEELIDREELSGSEKEKLQQYNPDPLQVAHMGPTGGTTGKPKIVPRSHNSLACGVEHCSLSWSQHCEDVNMIVGPIGHDLSFTKGFLGSIITQGKVVLADNSDNQTIFQAIEKEGVTSLILVPALAKKMLQYEDLDQHDLSTLKKMHSAGGASHPDLVEGVIEKLQMKFYNGYGGTEGMTSITRSADDLETTCFTVGRPTFPHDVYKIVDSFGNELPKNKTGELLVKGPCVFSGYFNNPDENEKMFTESGFFRTGDLAKIDDKGYISITGRIKEMINRGGESISSTVIESLINKHRDVVVSAVVPMPDPLMGEKACAYIQLKKGVTLTFEEIIDYIKSLKASVLELPERIEFIDEMPYTKVQKLNRAVLREDIDQKLKEEGVI